MNYVKTLRETDFEKLGRLKIFSWLSPSEVKALGGSLKMLNFQRNEIIFRESTVLTEAHVLVSGIARVTCLNGRNERVTVALIAPGAIPDSRYCRSTGSISAAKRTAIAASARWIGTASKA